MTLRIARWLLTRRLRRLQRRIDLDRWEPNLSGEIDRLTVALQALR